MLARPTRNLIQLSSDVDSPCIPSRPIHNDRPNANLAKYPTRKTFHSTPSKTVAERATLRDGRSANTQSQRIPQGSIPNCLFPSIPKMNDERLNLTNKAEHAHHIVTRIPPLYPPFLPLHQHDKSSNGSEILPTHRRNQTVNGRRSRHD